MDPVRADEPARTGASNTGEATHLRQVTRQQWRSGIAAWLGWTFDGLDMHLYTLVAAPFVAQLLGAAEHDRPARGPLWLASFRARFMLGWALGGGFFGRIGDRLGRARALSLTVLTYAVVHGAVVLCADVVAPAHLPVPGRAGHRRRMGGRARRCCRRPGRAGGGPGSRRCFRRASTSASSSPAWPISSWPPRRRGICFWSACCRRCWCSGFAARCPNRTNGAPPRKRPTTTSRACGTCSAARCGASPSGWCWSAACRSRRTGPSCSGTSNTCGTCPTC